jgi:two-component system, OmpR family, response regulator ArlR
VSNLESYKILLIEDEKQMAMYLQMELIHEGYSVDVEHDGSEGFKMAAKQEHDLILLDVMLPGLNGMEICRRIRQYSNVPIIMLTAKSEIIDRVMGLDLGADDYLTKPFAIEELLARIRVIRRKNIEKVKFHELKVDDLVMNNEIHQITRDGKIIELTKKEYELLEILLINKNIVLTREQLIEKVWGYVYVGDTKVVDVFISYLRSKIDDGYKNKIISTVRGVGYVIKGDKS